YTLSLHDALPIFILDSVHRRSQGALGLYRCAIATESWRSILAGRAAGVRRFGGAERLGFWLAIASQQDFDPLLRGLERALTVPRQRHAPLEGLERLFERQVATLEPRDQRLELGKRLLEVGYLALGHKPNTLYRRGCTGQCN